MKIWIIYILLFGGPPRAGMISYLMKSWAKNLTKLLRKQQLTVKKVAIWGTHSRVTPETPEKFSWALFKTKWVSVLDEFPAEKKHPEVIGFPVNPATLEGPLDPGWEEEVAQLAEDVKVL